MGRRNRDKSEQKPQEANAFVEESFVPGIVNVEGQENQPGIPPVIRLKQFYAPLGPGLFMFSRVATLTPDAAIAIGEAMVEEGRRVKSSVEIPLLELPPGADLREQGV